MMNPDLVKMTANKRPVAFRVRQHRLSNYYELYTDEKDAQFWADDRGVDYEGLYLVADRYLAPPANAGMREAYSALCLPRESQASDNLEGALYDIERLSAQGKPTDHVCIRTLKRVLKQLVTAEDALTAPDATTKSDGGWNEAIEACIQAARQIGNFGDYKREELTADYGRPKFDMMNAIINALTALRPGALTKSDGGGESRPANPGTGGWAPCIEQTTPAMMPAQAGVAPGPSDPSSTRSDVTEESLAAGIERSGFVVIGRFEAAVLARVLLDQFEIRRKK